MTARSHHTKWHMVILLGKETNPYLCATTFPRIPNILLVVWTSVMCIPISE